MIDAVLSYHADPISCGVTKFSQQLAKRLDVEWVCSADQQAAYRKASGLLSLKTSEVDGKVFHAPLIYDLFLHDFAVGEPVTSARRVFAASAAIADEIRPYRKDVITAWCPSLVEAHPREPITVLSFGMAHKLRTDLYETLKEKLDDTGEPYVVYVSAALHDGTTFHDAAASFETLRRLFGPHFVFLGTLSDEAMVDRLRTCTYVAAFFEHGLRENNTSVNAALEAGATVITNWDVHTPRFYQAWTWDVRSSDLVKTAQRNAIREEYGWDKLVELIRHA
jgi:hypothetical protein